MEEIKILTFFTDPYKDELVYSAIARYHFYSGNIDTNDTIEELFRSRTVTASVEIGSRFTILAEQLGSNYSVESLLAGHTIYPYYAPFLSAQRQQEVLSDVKGIGNGLYGRLGMTGGGICRKYGLYYCSLCAIEDVEKYGESYIHREHQLQGIEYCAHHETKLKKYAIESRGRNKYEYIRFDEKVLDLTNSLNVGQDEFSIIQIKLAKMAYQLFHLPNNKVSIELINLNYRALLRQRNLIKGENMIRKSEFYRTFLKKFPNGFLEKYESSLNNKYGNNWIDRITQKTKIHIHPFRHLLMIYFLDQDIESLLATVPDQGPFGTGPWPCLNKFAEHFEQDVVNKLVIQRSRENKGPIGEFSCSCGFVYTMGAPGKKANDQKRIRSIKDYGESWRAQLKELYRSGLSIHKIAKQLEVYPNVIKHQLKDSEKSKDGVIAYKEESIKRCRIEMLKGMEKYPDYSRTELLGRFKEIYQFLLRNDNEWFNSNLPKKDTKRVLPKKVDWNLRDSEYLEKIKVLYEELLELDKPIRITRTDIGRRLNILANIERRGMKMPHTNQFLNEITESVQDFQIRNCLKVIDKSIEDGEPVIFSEVRKKARVYSLCHFNEIKPKLEDYIKDKDGDND